MKSTIFKTSLLIVGLLLAIAAPVLARPLMLGTSPTLGPIAPFSVFADAGVTNVPISVIGGLVGATNQSYTGITGVSDTTTLNNASSDMMAAYLYLDQGCDTVSGFGFGGGQIQLGGLDLVPGVYCADSFLLTGNLNLTGTTGVWIFKSAETLTVESGASVTGGDPCNVWWRNVSSVSLGTDSNMIGSIFAGTQIAMQTRATLAGRVLAQTIVTLDQNTISIPVCTPVTGPTQVVPGLPNAGGRSGTPVQDGTFSWSLILFFGIVAFSILVGTSKAFRKTSK